MADRTVTVKLRGDVDQYTRAMRRAAKETREFSKTASAISDKSIHLKVETRDAKEGVEDVKEDLRDLPATKRTRVQVDGTRQASKQVSNLTALITALGPAAVPAAAAVSGAMVGAAGTVGALAAGMGVAALAAGGLGDALDAMNKASIEPTEANIENLQVAMSQMSVAGADFTTFLFSLKPRFQELQGLAQAGLLPGVEDGIRELLGLFPSLERLVGLTSAAMGELASDAGEALNSPFWRGFIDFIADEAGPTLTTFGRIVGNLGEGFAGMMMAFDPLADDMGDALLDLSQKFSTWGRQLSDNEGFRDFVSYVQEVSPQVFDTLTSLVNALGAIVEAGAPVGPVVLTGIRALADTIAFIAGIPGVGTTLIAAAAGIAAVSRAIRLYDVAKHSRIVELLSTSGAAGKGASAGMRSLAAATGIAGAAIALTVPILGRLNAAIHGSAPEVEDLVGALLKLDSGGRVSSGALDQLGLSVEQLQDDVETLSKTGAEKMFQKKFNLGELTAATDRIQSLDQALAQLVASGNTDAAANAVKTLGLETGELNRLFPRYTRALRQNQQAAAEVTPAQRELGERLGLTGGKARGAAEAVDLLDSELQALLDSTFGVEAAQDEYRQQLINLREQIKNTSAATRGNSQAALNNRESIRGVLGALFQMIEAEAEAGTGKQDLIRKTNRWREELIRELKQMGVNKQEVRRYTKVLNQTPELIKTLFDAITSGAIKDTRDLRKFFNEQLNKISDEDVEIKTKVRVGPGGAGHLFFQAGGGRIRGPGTETSDSIPAMLSNDEYVVRAASAKSVGFDRLEHINRTGALPGFAVGGRVATDVDVDTTAARSEIRRIAKRMNERLGRLRQFVPGGNALAFARAQEGDPYIWGGVGPNGYDCSGFMSAVTNVIAGRNPFQRLFTTFSFSPHRGAAGFVPGLSSPFMIGVTNRGAGHMAGTLLGVNVESSGSSGVRVGPEARGAFDPLFGMRFGYAGPGMRGLEGATFDSGMGVLPARSAIVAANGTGRDEFILSEERLAKAIAGAIRGGDGVTYQANFAGPVERPQRVRAAVMNAFRDLETLHPVR